MKKLLFLIALCVPTISLFACSTFLLSKDGKHVFGRNYDWVTGNGLMIVNARGVMKTSFVSGKEVSMSWTSRFGSITFNQFGKEFPHGGMNEKGLVIELMWLSETNYPDPDQRPALSELQWIQYQLDNHSTIQEVIDSDKELRISRAGAAPIHFLIADASGKAATIEFINGKMTVHTGDQLPLPVLTNTVYSDAAQQYKTTIEAKDGSGFKGNSMQRFATACNLVKQFNTTSNNTPPVDYAFGVLQKVSQPGFTRWSIVYDINNRTIYWTTDTQPVRKEISFNDFDLTCSNAASSIDLNSPSTGKVSTGFKPLSFEQNEKTIEQSARESRSQISIPPAAVKAVADYFRQARCK